jgi:hypothetical protein
MIVPGQQRRLGYSRRMEQGKDVKAYDVWELQAQAVILRAHEARFFPRQSSSRILVMRR